MESEDLQRVIIGDQFLRVSSKTIIGIGMAMSESLCMIDTIISKHILMVVWKFPKRMTLSMKK